MARIDLTDYLADDRLALDGIPSKKFADGRTYYIPSLSAADGLLLQKISAGTTATDGDSMSMTGEAQDAMTAFCRDSNGNEIGLNEKVFGPALAEMIDDGVSHTRLDMIATVVVSQASGGTATAQMFVDRTLSGEAVARANRAERRDAAKKAAASSRKAGTKSSRASTAGRTRSTPASTRARTPSAAKSTPKPAPVKKTA